MKLSSKQKRFAEEIAKGESLEAAHKLAGYAGSRSNAHRLLKTPEVAAKVEELKRQAAEASKVDHQWLISRAQRVYDRAMTLNKLSSATAALTLIGRVAGLFTESLTHTHSSVGEVHVYLPHNGRDSNSKLEKGPNE